MNPWPRSLKEKEVSPDFPNSSGQELRCKNSAFKVDLRPAYRAETSRFRAPAKYRLSTTVPSCAGAGNGEACWTVRSISAITSGAWLDARIHLRIQVEDRLVEYEIKGNLTISDTLFRLDAALDGIGLAYTFEQLAQPHIQAGRLKRVLASFSPTFPGFYLYYPSRRNQSTKLKALIECARHCTP